MLVIFSINEFNFVLILYSLSNIGVVFNVKLDSVLLIVLFEVLGYFESYLLFDYNISLSLGVINLLSFVFLNLFNNILILLNIDLLILLYPKFNTDKFYSIPLS